MRPTGFFRRIGAMLYDSLLLFAVLMMVTVPFVGMRGGEAVEPLSDNAYRLTLLLTMLIFFAGFWLRGGRTLGMQAWRLQLQMRDGRPVTVGAAVLRFFAAILSWIPCGLGYLWQLWDKEQLTWHDRISDTRILFFPKTDEASSADS